MSKLDWLKKLGELAPIVLAMTPLAPIAGPVAAAMHEAEEIHGDDSGAAKLSHVVGIAQQAATAVNAQAGKVVIAPDLIPGATAQIVSAIISVANVAGKDPRFLGPPVHV
jgi:hypothetical protein